jgi:hypothetical protein
VFAITVADLEYLAGTLLSGIRTTPMSNVRLAGEHGVHCEVIHPVGGLRDRADRTASLLTAWQIRWDGDAPRLSPRTSSLEFGRRWPSSSMR